MAVDFWEGKVYFNFNDTALPQKENVFEAGWSEKYYFPITQTVANVRTNFRNIIAARAALLPYDAYVYRASFGQASIYRDTYAVSVQASAPVVDSLDATGISGGQPGYCNSVEAALLIRYEGNVTAGGGNPAYTRRWQRVVRMIKDYWETNEATTQLVNKGYGSGAFDDPLPTVQTAPATGTEAVFTVSIVGGAIDSISVAAGSTGYANNGSVVLTYLPLVAADGLGSGGVIGVTITAGVVGTPVIIAPGTGYTNVVGSTTLFKLPLKADTNGLAQYQTPQAYFLNYCAAVRASCINFHPVRVANASFRSGFMTQVDDGAGYPGAPYTANRFLLQRFTNRQTGQINISRPGRKKRAI